MIKTNTIANTYPNLPGPSGCSGLPGPSGGPPLDDPPDDSHGPGTSPDVPGSSATDVPRRSYVSAVLVPKKEKEKVKDKNSEWTTVNKNKNKKNNKDKSGKKDGYETEDRKHEEKVGDGKKKGNIQM